MSLSKDDAEKLIRKWAVMDESGQEFLGQIYRLVRLADDIADGDSDNPPKDMAQLLFICLVEVGGNKFFQKHHQTLAPVISNVALLWDASEEWRKSDNEKTRMFAFVLRESVEQIVVTVAMICGGYEHARATMMDLHRNCDASSPETFKDWETE